MLKCPECGANFPQTSFVCQYCGYVITERVSQVENKNNLSFSEQMQIIDSNLNALYEINHPTVADGFLKIIRIWLAIQTFGIILIFWKKQKNKFDKKRYNKLKAIVQRNIAQLKLSSKGSNDLLNKIEITENELKNIDNDIKKNIKSRRIVTFVVVFLYISIIFINSFDKKEGIYLRFDNIHSIGNLKENFNIETKKCYLNEFSSTKYLEKIDFTIKLSIKKQYIPQKNEEFDFGISLLDEYGNERIDFDAIPISKDNIEHLKWMLENDVKKSYFIKFEFIPNKRMFSSPIDLKKFSIKANISKQNDKN